jgi:hypothetical protein
MNTARYSLAGAGSQTAALGFGGYSTNYRCRLKLIMELLGQVLLV